MQIKLSEANEEDLKEIVKVSRRSITQEVNLCLELYIAKSKPGWGGLSPKGKNIKRVREKRKKL